jgi:hypothetical protein
MIFLTARVGINISVSFLLVWNLLVANATEALKSQHLENQGTNEDSSGKVRKLRDEGEINQGENVKSRHLNRKERPHAHIDSNGLLSAVNTEHQHGHTRCGTPDPTSEENAMVNKVISNWIQKGPSMSSLADSTIYVGIYFHIITDGTVGQVSESQIGDQLKVLNQRFYGSGFTFILRCINRHSNSNWYKSADDTQMKNTLRKGGRYTLNVYLKDLSVLGDNDHIVAGYARFPWDNPGSLLDGVVCDNRAIPGGAFTGNLGLTLVHEVGHWLGLYHTFQGGCDGTGDEVSDTPAEASYTYGCPTGRDTCPNSPGLDPITNYMDYTDESCKVS